MITYWTAWLKLNYGTEFMFATLRNEGDKDSITDYLIEAKRLGIRILLPHVEKSGMYFEIEGDAIRFGLINIKGLAEKTSSKVIEHRPFGSYQALVEKVAEKGSGLTSSVLKGLNAVGGAVYADNPLRGDERDNFYEYLSIPAFETKTVPPRVKTQFVPLDEYDDSGAFPVLGMVKKITRKNGWARADIVDETGTTGVFMDDKSLIEEGQMYALLIASNRIARFAPIDEVRANSTNSFVKHLFSKGYPELTDNFYRVVAFNTRTTKAGKKMATMVISDGEKNLVDVLVFPQQFHKAFGRCREGSTVGLDLKTTDDGALFLESIY